MLATSDPFVPLEETRNDANFLRQFQPGMPLSQPRDLGPLPKGEVEILYEDPILRRVVGALPKSAIQKGWELSLGGKQKSDRLSVEAMRLHKELKVPQRFKEAQIFAHAYGGAAILLVADDGRSADRPLNLKALRGIRRLKVLHRYQIEPVFPDWGDWDLEEVRQYRLVGGVDLLGRSLVRELYGNRSATGLIHASRLLHFDGIEDALPDSRARYNGWTVGLLESLLDDYDGYKSGIEAAVAMLRDFSLFVLKSKGLRGVIERGNEQKLHQWFGVIRALIAMFGGFMIDKDNDEVEYLNRNFGGIEPIIGKIRESFIGASGIPHDKLFGESPSGLGATGEDEARVWADEVAGFQVSVWQPKLRGLFEKLLAIASRATAQAVPDDWEIVFPSIARRNEQSDASLRSQNAATDSGYIRDGVLSPEEVRQSRFGGAEYSNEIALDEKLFRAHQQQSQGGGGFGYEQQQQPPQFEFEQEPRGDSVRFDAVREIEGAIASGCSLARLEQLASALPA